MDVDEVMHFLTGEPIAKVGRANAGLIQRDMRKAASARDALRKIPVAELIARMKVAGDLYMNAELPLGDGTQTPDDFAKQQSASTGPARSAVPREHEEEPVRAQRDGQHPQVADARARSQRVDDRLRRRERRADQLSGAEPVLGLVLPSNSPGVHTLWLPIIPMQIGLVLKPGPQEPWTPYRVAEAFFQAGIPREAISIYPGEAEVGAAVVGACGRSLIFGGTADRRALQGESARAGARPGILARSSSATIASTIGSATST